METRLLPASTRDDRESISAAVDLLREGEVVALPTETVYGLAADATNPAAVAKIFAAKERPSFNPLIVHLPQPEALYAVATLPHASEQLTLRLIHSFWPGPLTLILPALETTAPAVRAGQPTLAVRISAHPVFSAVCMQLDRPLAAPSANRFGKISPTRAEHVLSELGGRIPLILDSGATYHGLESTIIRVKDNEIEVLRPGPVTIETLNAFAPTRLAVAGPSRPDQPAPIAPGQLPTHYAPTTSLQLVDPLPDAPTDALSSGILLWNRSDWSPVVLEKFGHVVELSPRLDPSEAARVLYTKLREMDQVGLKRIFVQRLPAVGIGKAIMDRLEKASGPRL